MGTRREELEAAQSSLAALGRELAHMQQRVAMEEERVGLLRRLVELDERRDVALNGREEADPKVSQQEDLTKSVTKGRLEDIVIDILADRNEAVHIGEIRSQLVQRGIRIPGKGTDSNIIARIMKEPSIEREAGRRGFYRLRRP